MSTWPHTELPGAGPLAEYELDAACWRKRQITLTTEQMRAVDDTAGLCGTCGGKCPTPQACEQPEDVHDRQRRSIVIVAAVLGVAIVATCLLAYLRAPT